MSPSHRLPRRGLLLVLCTILLIGAGTGMGVGNPTGAFSGGSEAPLPVAIIAVDMPGADIENQTDDSIEIVHIELAESEVVVGSVVTVAAVHENAGQETETVTVELFADGDSVDVTTIDVPPDEEAVAVLSTRFDQPGAYDLTVNGQPAGTVTITTFDIVAVDAPDTVTVGDMVTVAITVENPGPSTGTFQQSVSVEREVRELLEATLEPGERETFEIEFRVIDDRTWTVRSGGDVLAEIEAEEDQGPMPIGGIITLLAIAVAIALGGGAIYFKRKAR